MSRGWLALGQVIYIFVGTFFLLNLCVSVIVDKFSDIKEQTGAVLLTPAQQQWQEGRRMLQTRQQLLGVTHLHDLPVSRQTPTMAPTSILIHNPK